MLEARYLRMGYGCSSPMCHLDGLRIGIDRLIEHRFSFTSFSTSVYTRSRGSNHLPEHYEARHTIGTTVREVLKIYGVNKNNVI